jgi:hypothetical protein
MPNGVDKNLIRLAAACAEFRARYGAWPDEARLAPIAIWDFGQLFDIENFERLFAVLRIRATKHAHIAVGNSQHHVVYEKLETNPTPNQIDEALAWLAVRVRPELAHFD